MNVDPWALCEVLAEPAEARGAVLLHFLDGFMDAGQAGRGVVDHLFKTCEHTPVASFDVDQLIDYRSRRPNLTFSIDRWSDFEAPQLVVYLMRDAADKPFLLMTGPEPDFAWERFVDSVEDLVEHWHVPLTLGFQGIPMGVPHTRPLGMTVHATRPELVFDNRPVFNEVTVPGNAAGLLEYRLGESGRDAIGLSVHVPHYVMQMTYPAASLRLLEGIREATGLDLPSDEELEVERAQVDSDIAEQVAESEEVADVVKTLEEQYDSFTEAAEADEMLQDGRMPTADELGAAFEHFLAERQRGEDDK
ncbi:PAC2 family protein [Glycomyces luteolus]|uniref:PAC2 family protein n=1 Tax=Glycomyces luteolus TaxID=2670330 RepID=A0A9X3PC68_9ACTN|nr:PAC2 family protein [Glycomyces luteolus]MDA1359899.1 PAC2 family protein [Glycomyces luteolus]